MPSCRHSRTSFFRYATQAIRAVATQSLILFSFALTPVISRAALLLRTCTSAVQSAAEPRGAPPYARRRGALTSHSTIVCARRLVTPLVKDGQASPAVGRYLNRLSDFLFVAARHAAKADGKEEVIYKKPKD